MLIETLAIQGATKSTLRLRVGSLALNVVKQLASHDLSRTSMAGSVKQLASYNLSRMPMAGIVNRKLP